MNRGNWFFICSGPSNAGEEGESNKMIRSDRNAVDIFFIQRNKLAEALAEVNE